MHEARRMRGDKTIGDLNRDLARRRRLEVAVIQPSAKRLTFEQLGDRGTVDFRRRPHRTPSRHSDGRWTR